MYAPTYCFMQDLVGFKVTEADDEIDAVQEEDLELNKELMMLSLGLLNLPQLQALLCVCVC